MASMIFSGTSLPTQFVLGMLHGLDPDHVLAVTGLASAAPVSGPPWRTTHIAFSWGVGHGLVLLVLAVPVLYLGMIVPQAFAWWFEAAIGALLVMLGLNLFRAAFASTHHHGQFALTRDHPDASIQRAGLLGMLHGTAGWFTLSALIPISLRSEPAIGMTYLAAFSTGVVVAIVLAALVLARLLARWSCGSAMRTWRLGLAIVTISYGGYWVYVSR